MRRFLLFLYILVFLGCGAKIKTPVDYQASSASISSSELAYVLVGYASCASTAWIHTSRSYFAKGDDPYDFVRLEAGSALASWGVGCEDEKYHLFHVKPGKYTLTDFNYLSIYMADNAIKLNEQIKEHDSLFGEFNVKKGELAYIGTLHFKEGMNTEEITFVVTDKREDAVKFIKENYPEIDAAIMVYNPIKPGRLLR
ncbi:MAG: hypothetical protein LBP51_08145 [Deferribacteraceae bacterium]|jgi:hypothetical protein|nr:hypothetical protein [Deferribacteraceae bacterium]